MSHPAGVVGILFTDLVGSREVLDRLGDAAAEDLRRTHVSLLRRAVAETGGTEAKTLADGLTVAFASPAKALECAVQMQRAIAEHNRTQPGQLMLRVGVHAGEPLREEDDLHGAAVVVAKRLCDQAQGGQILASDLVAGLTGGTRGEFRLHPVGHLELQGLSDSVPTVSVDWAGTAAQVPRGAGVRVVAADDSYLIREGLRSLLSTQADLDLVANVGSFPALLSAVDEHSPDVVVTDIRMPPNGADEGIRAAELLARSHPGLGVVVLSQYVEPEWAVRLFDLGASGRAYLLKERVGDLGQLRHAIDTVVAGGSVLDPLVVEALVQGSARHARSPLSRLTPRETEVLELVASGLSNSAIAARLILTERAVEKHVTSVLAKLDLPADDPEVHRRVRAVLVYLSSVSG